MDIISADLISRFANIAHSTSTIHNYVKKTLPTLPYGHKLSVAPTVLQFSGDVFMAVDRYCMVSGGVICGDQHQVSSAKDHSLSRELKGIVYRFIKELVPEKKYCIVLYETDALFGHNHVLPTLLAVWQLFRSFESEIYDDEDLKLVLLSFLKKQDTYRLDTSFRIHEFEAILQGSITNVHIRCKSDNSYDNEPIEYFFNSTETEMIFISLAGLDSSREPIESSRKEHVNSRSIRNFVKHKFPKSSQSVLISYVDQERNITQMEKDLELAMEELFDSEENIKLELGFDVQEEGVLMVFPKGTFENTHILRNIFKSIYHHSAEIPTKVTFDLLIPAKGVNVAFKKNFPDKEYNRTYFDWDFLSME
ncbi:unnamed protein product [Caenorhabditis brenneri]